MNRIILALALLALLLSAAPMPVMGDAHQVYLPFVAGGSPLYDAISMTCAYQPNAPMRIGCYVWSADEFASMGDAINFVWGDVQLNGRVLKASACGASDDEIEQLWASHDGLTFWHLYKRGGVYSNCYKLYAK